MREELELPPGFIFDDLQLEREPAAKGFSVGNGDLLDRILAYNGINPALLDQHPSNLLIRLRAVASCYRVHIAQGGVPNEIMEQLNAGTLHL